MEDGYFASWHLGVLALNPVALVAGDEPTSPLLSPPDRRAERENVAARVLELDVTVAGSISDYLTTS